MENFNMKTAFFRRIFIFCFIFFVVIFLVFKYFDLRYAFTGTSILQFEVTFISPESEFIETFICKDASEITRFVDEAKNKTILDIRVIFEVPVETIDDTTISGKLRTSINYFVNKFWIEPRFKLVRI